MSPLAKSIGSLEECIRQIRQDCAETIERNRRNSIENMNERIKLVETNRPIIAMLDAEGFDVRVSSWVPGNFYLDLGFFPSTRKGSADLADKLRRIRRIIDCKLGQPSKSLKDGEKRLVEFTLQPMEGMHIDYTRKLPKSSKCKIVVQRRTDRSLVCEV